MSKSSRVWTLKGVPYLISATIDTSNGATAGLLGLDDEAELYEFLLKPAMINFLRKLNKWSRQKFAWSPPSLWKIIESIQDEVFDVKDCDVSADLVGATEGTSGHNNYRIILLCHQIIEAFPSLVSEEGIPMARHTSITWMRAMVLMKTLPRIVKRQLTVDDIEKGQLSVEKIQELIKNIRKSGKKAIPPTLIKTEDTEGASAVTAVIAEDPLELDESGAPSKKTYETTEELELATMLEEDEEGIFDLTPEECATFLDRVTDIYLGQYARPPERGARRPMTRDERTATIKTIFRESAKVLHEGKTVSDMSDTKRMAAMLADAEDAHQDLAMYTKIDQSLTAGSRNLYATTYEEACQILNLPNGVLPIEQRGGLKRRDFHLLPWQVIAMAWLDRMDAEDIAALLADECGLGKTATVLSYLYWRTMPDRIHRPPYKPILVIVPGILVENWFNDIKKHFGNAFMVRIFHSTQSSQEAGPLRGATIEPATAKGLTSLIDALDALRPETARTIVITAYNTAWSRLLLDHGERPQSLKKKRQDQKDQKDRGRRFRGRRGSDADSDDEVGLEDADYSSLLTGQFGWVICDEAHKIKNASSLAHQFVKVVEPEHLIFLTATPIPNTIKDLLGYLQLQWKEDWTDLDIERNVDQAFGIVHPVLQDGSDDEAMDTAPVTAVTAGVAVGPPRKGLLNPAYLRSYLREGQVETYIATSMLPKLLELMCLRRGFGATVVMPEGQPPLVIGADIPTYTLTTVELGMHRAYAGEYGKVFAKAIQTISNGGDVDTNEIASGHRDNATHTRLVHMTNAWVLERLGEHRKRKAMNVDQVRRYYAKDSDMGMSFLWMSLKRDGYMTLPTDRPTMARWLTRQSPKLAWLAHRVWVMSELERRVLVFCGTPQIQWMVEAMLSMLQFELLSIRSAHTTSQRQMTINRFNDRKATVDAMVVSTQLAAYGLNIQDSCADVVFVDIPDNIATIIQGIGRVHRLGQREKQAIHILFLDNSYDLHRMQRVMEKYRPELEALLAMHLQDSEQPVDAAAVRDDAENHVKKMLGLRFNLLRLPRKELFSFETQPPQDITAADLARFATDTPRKMHRYANPKPILSNETVGDDDEDEDEDDDEDEDMEPKDPDVGEELAAMFAEEARVKRELLRARATAVVEKEQEDLRRALMASLDAEGDAKEGTRPPSETMESEDETLTPEPTPEPTPKKTTSRKTTSKKTTSKTTTPKKTTSKKTTPKKTTPKKTTAKEKKETRAGRGATRGGGNARGKPKGRATTSKPSLRSDKDDPQDMDEE